MDYLRPNGWLPAQMAAVDAANRSTDMHRRITVYFNDNTERELVVNKHDGVRTEESEGHTIVHFGRTNSGSPHDGRWTELLAAPMTSVHHWS